MLSELTLREFRCFEALRVNLGPGVTVFVGENAQGKTSILEAACVLLRLQSPRTSNRADWVRAGQAGCMIEGTLDERVLRYRQTASGRRLMSDGEQVGRTADYLSFSGLVVWMGNEDLQLARGRGENRRRYLDFIASQIFPGYHQTLKDYEKTLRSRNFLLKRDAVPRWREIDAYTELLVRHGEKLVRWRRELIESLEPWVRDAQSALSRDNEEAGMEYAPSVAEGGIGQAIEESRAQEERLRQTVVGPHRDDVSLTVNNMAAAQFASEGQQRSLVLALRLAQARHLEAFGGSAPLLLIDDVFGELDVGRRNALLAYLPEKAQKLITTTHLDWANDSPLWGDIDVSRLEMGSLHSDSVRKLGSDPMN